MLAIAGRLEWLALTATENIQTRRNVMAKGQMRSNKEKKKPKAEWNKNKRKGGPNPSPFALGQSESKPTPYAKKQ